MCQYFKSIKEIFYIFVYNDGWFTLSHELELVVSQTKVKVTHVPKKMSWTEEVKVDVLKLGATLHMQNEPLFLLV